MSWIARRGLSTSELLRESGRSVTAVRHEFPDVGWYILKLEGNENLWTLLIADGTENVEGLSASTAQQLSQGINETLFFWCSDTVMASELFSFKNGKEVWSIQYDSGDEQKRPTINGAVPPVVHQLLKDLRTKQQQDDGADFIYDLTAEVGRSLVGFRHDMEVELDDPQPFQLLSPTEKQRSWWQFWKR